MKNSFNQLLVLFVLLVNNIVYSQNIKLFYSEEFTHPTYHWYYSDNDAPDVTKKIENGSLRITQRKNSVYYTYCSAKIDPTKPFKIETSTKFTSCEAGGGFHLLLFGEDSKNFYFGFNPTDKKIWIGSEQKGTWETIHEEVDNAGLLKGLNETNIVSLERKGLNLIFSINGKEIMSKLFLIKFKEISKTISYNGFGTSYVGETLTDNYKIFQENSINLITTEPTGMWKQKLSAKVNSSTSDRAPIISPDGNFLYFIRSGHAENIGGGTDNMTDIWYSEKNKEGEWDYAKHLGNPINNPSHNMVLSLTPDNNSLYLMSQYKPDGSFKSVGFSQSRRTLDGWAAPEDIVVKNFLNNGDHNEFCFSSDKKIIIHCIKHTVNNGMNDLYVSFKNEDGTYTEPLHMGNAINTAGDEISPFLASDNKTLYFGTNGLPGYGSSDIYVTRRLDDTWTNWSTPQNLGSEINSAMWEAYFSLTASGKYGYIVGNDGSSDDIYQIEMAKMFRPEPVVIVSGTVYNAKTKKPMDADILYSDISTNKNPGLASSNPSNGNYKIALPAGSVYQFLGKKDGFFPTSENLDLKSLTEYTEIKKDLYLNPIEVGQVVRLNNLFFDTGKSDLKPESFSELERIIEMLTKNPTLKIEIGGHTDNVGDDAYNKRLSQARADAVVNYLLKNNVNTAQMKGVGYGETKPSSPNTTEQGKAMNRRVEFIIKSK